jgi:hypothetical protein
MHCLYCLSHMSPCAGHHGDSTMQLCNESRCLYFTQPIMCDKSAYVQSLLTGDVEQL